MQSRTSFGCRLAGALCLIGVLGTVSAVVTAQTSAPLLVVLDLDALEHRFAPDAINDPIAGVGVRDPLPFFAANIGQRIALPGKGWFGFVSVPVSWHNPGTEDGLQNYFLAGEGLGSPDPNGDRASQLGAVPGVVGLQSGQFAGLVGRTICGVVYNNRIPTTGTPPVVDLRGKTLGVIAGRVVAVTPDAATVEIEILASRDACSAELALFSPTQ
jgi:hypothetical protein